MSTSKSAARPSPRTTTPRDEHAGEYDELEGLITGIRACAQIAMLKYDSDDLNFKGLFQLAERADLVLQHLQFPKPGGAR